MSKICKLLYVYVERIPENLRNLVLNSFSEDEFEINKMTYLARNWKKEDVCCWDKKSGGLKVEQSHGNQ